MARLYRHTDITNKLLSEECEQINLINRCNASLDELPELALIFHIANGGIRSKPAATRLRQAGVKAGIPDLCLPVARQGWNGLYIELKRKKLYVVSEKQKAWHELLLMQNYKCVTCLGCDEAWGILVEYLSFPAQNNVDVDRMRELTAIIYKRSEPV